MTRHEAIVQALMAALGGVSAELMREEVLPIKCPDAGVLNVVPGDPEEVGFILGTGRREYERPVQLELVVRGADQTTRITRLEALLAAIAEPLVADLTLAGAVDHLLVDAPVDVENIPMEGASALKGAVVQLTLFYETSDNPMEVTS